MSKNEFDNAWLIGYMAKRRAEKDPLCPFSDAGSRDVPDPGLQMPQPIIPESRMNKTESRFADYLEQLKHMKEIIDWRFEPLKFILAQNVKGARNATTFLPDFLLVRPDCFEFMEVKAKSGDWTSVRDDALVKIKVVSEMFPWFRFTLAYYEKGEWTFKRV